MNSRNQFGNREELEISSNNINLRLKINCCVGLKELKKFKTIFLNMLDQTIESVLESQKKFRSQTKKNQKSRTKKFS